MSRQAYKWGKILPKLAYIDREPEDEVLAFLDQSLAHPGLRGIDIGCGLGRHTLAALDRGYQMVALDFCDVAISQIQKALLGHKAHADVHLASMDSLPFANDEFDFSLAWCVLNHGTHSVFRQALLESIRVLRPGGSAFGLIMTRDDARYGKGLSLGEDCFMLTEGLEAGICHYFPSIEMVETVLSRVGIVQELREIRYGDDAMQLYHPTLSQSCHVLYHVRKT